MFFRDLREAVLALWRRPAAPALAVAVLSLGIGANAAIFSLVDAVLFRPLPAERPEQLVRLLSASSAQGTDPGRVSQPFGADYQAAASSFSSLEMWSDRLPVDFLLEGRSAERLTAAVASPGFFSCLGIAPAVGRLLGPHPDQEAVAVLSYRLWERAFDRDPRAVGTLVRINRQPFVIVGVAPPGFEGVGLEALPDVWLPVSQLAVAVPAWRDQGLYRSSAFFHAVGRLAPGVALGAAQAEVAMIAARLGAGQPALAGPEVEDPGWREPWPWLEPAAAVAGRSARPLARLLAGAAGLVLALACADVAGLMLARAEGRRRELAVRAALGASHWRVLRPLVMEAALLALAGTLAGLLVAHAALRLFLAAAPADVGLPLSATSTVLALRVLAGAAGLALLATLLAGVWPAFHAARAAPLAALRSDPPTGVARWLSTRGILVALQVGVATVLLIGVGALLRSLWTAGQIQPGIEVGRILVADLDLARGGYDKARGAAFAARLADALSRSPGAPVGALSIGVPLAGGPRTTVTIDGQEAPVDFVMVTPGYFETLAMRPVQGRTFEREDGAHAPPVAIVNRAFVGRFWPDANPIGRQIAGFTPRKASLVVAGVVPDLRTHGLREPVHPLVYVPMAQFYEAFPWQFGLTVIVRTDGPRSGSVRIENSVHALDPMLPVLRPRTLAAVLGEPFAQQHLLAWLLGGFALVALLLAGTGLYGVVSLATAARTREFGVRLAVGALPLQLRRLVYGRALALCGLGLGGGLAALLAVHRALQPFVFGVSSIDPWALGIPPIVLLLVSLIAAAGPARRASSVETSEALRHE